MHIDIRMHIDSRAALVSVRVPTRPRRLQDVLLTVLRFLLRVLLLLSRARLLRPSLAPRLLPLLLRILHLRARNSPMAIFRDIVALSSPRSLGLVSSW